MDKLTMAHEYAMKHVQDAFYINYDVLVVEAWQYADAMQAEADKRKVSGIPDVLRGANGEIVAVKVARKNGNSTGVKRLIGQTGGVFL